MLRSFLFLVLIAAGGTSACLTARRRFESRIPQTTTGAPQLFGPGIESALELLPEALVGGRATSWAAYYIPLR